MSERDQEKAREAREALERVRRDTETLGSSALARMGRQAGEHFRAKDAVGAGEGGGTLDLATGDDGLDVLAGALRRAVPLAGLTAQCADGRGAVAGPGRGEDEQAAEHDEDDGGDAEDGGGVHGFASAL